MCESEQESFFVWLNRWLGFLAVGFSAVNSVVKHGKGIFSENRTDFTNREK